MTFTVVRDWGCSPIFLRLAAVLSVFALSLWIAPSVGATQSPDQCDTSGPKYWCTHITYDISGSTYTVHERDWEGAIDNGALRWQLLFAKDYYGQNGTGWTLNRSYGATSWLTNIYLGQWWCYCGDDALSGGGYVELQLNYFEDQPYDHNWTSDDMIHYLT